MRAVIALLLLLVLAPPAAAKSPAVCGEGDRPEPGLQGQVPKADQGDDSRKGYWCAIGPVGHTSIENRGANYQLAWSGDCAYVSTIFAGSEEAPAGVAVIDASDPRAPQVTGYLTGPGSAAAAETLHAVDAPDRRILVAGSYDTAPTGQLEVYDVADCARPRLITTFETPYPMHNITLTRDARTLYVGTATPQAPHAFVVDLTELADPKVIATLDLAQMAPYGARTGPLGIHRVEVSPDGRRAYAGVTSAGFLAPPAKAPFQGGELAIFDTGDIAARRPNPQMRFISQFKNGWHGPRWFRTRGREYVVGGDEANNTPLGPTYAGSCEGVWPFIGDVTDETAPKPVSEFRMEIQQTENCPESLQDGLLYATHYSDIDDPDNAALGLFPMYHSGLRVADIRDPANPVEVGYFNPPPLSGTQSGDTMTSNEDVDLSGSNVRYHPRTGHIWFASMTSGFWIVELAGSGPARDLGLPPAAAPAPAQPAPGACLRTLRVKLPHGLRWARIFVNGRRDRSLGRRGVRVPVTLRRLPRRPVRVKIVARRRSGRAVKRTRRYPSCQARSAATGWSR